MAKKADKNNRLSKFTPDVDLRNNIRKGSPVLTPEQELYEIRKTMSAMRDREKVLAKQVFQEFMENGQRRGEHFVVSVKQTLKVTEPEMAFSWAAERNCLVVDTTKAMAILRREFQTPDFFEIRKTEYLRMAGSNDETNPGDDS